MMKSNVQNNMPKRIRNSRVTLRDIARELDVSHVTVSLALRNNPRISDATRVRVQQKAEEMGYQPDLMLSALSRYRLTNQTAFKRRGLAWVSPSRELREPHQLEEGDSYWKGAADAAQQLGFHLEKFSNETGSRQELIETFKEGNICGMITAPTVCEDPNVQGVDFSLQDVPGVCFGPNQQNDLMHKIASDESFNMMLAYNKTLEKGYQRIGFVGDVSRSMLNASYIHAQHAQPISRQMSPLIFENEDFTQKRTLLASWMKKWKPDAILTEEPELIAMLESLGISVPDDVGVATLSLQDTPMNAGIDQNPEAMGCEAIHYLVYLLNGHRPGISPARSSTLLKGHWVDGPMLPDRTECYPA